MPMSFEQYQRGEESAAFAQFLVSVIADLYGCDHTPAAIDRAVYKNTDCGAWCQFNEYGIKVGTIVEGSDAEMSVQINISGLDCDEESEKTLIARFRYAIKECEDFATESQLRI